MIKNKKFTLFKKILMVAFLIYTLPCYSTNPKNTETLTISPQIALPIGIKIWFNESGGSINGLTTWNNGEDFASLGIGHFIWHPYPCRKASFNSGFPGLLKYIKANSKGNVLIPLWLQGKGALYCPWEDREKFIASFNSKKMVELRHFLQQTIPLQAKYMTKQLQDILPSLLASAPKDDRKVIYQNFSNLATTPAGIYAMVDYLNFKGSGITKSHHNYQNGSGLLQVLNGMKYAPAKLTPIKAFVWSAKKALIRRVDRSHPSKFYERWLAGWFKRLNTYIEGDFEQSC